MKAKFNYTLSGHVHGAGASSKPRIACVFREDITYDNGTQHTCSTNDQAWTGVRT